MLGKLYKSIRSPLVRGKNERITDISFWGVLEGVRTFLSLSLSLGGTRDPKHRLHRVTPITPGIRLVVTESLGSSFDACCLISVSSSSLFLWLLVLSVCYGRCGTGESNAGVDLSAAKRR